MDQVNTDYSTLEYATPQPETLRHKWSNVDDEKPDIAGGSELSEEINRTAVFFSCKGIAS